MIARTSSVQKVGDVNSPDPVGLRCPSTAAHASSIVCTSSCVGGAPAHAVSNDCANAPATAVMLA
jgi:hypothetical protein